MAHTDASVDALTLRHFLRAALQYKFLSATSLLIFVQSICLGIALPFLIGKILGSLGTNPEKADSYIVPLIAVALTGVVCNYVGFRALFTLEPKVMVALEREALSTLLSRSVGFHNNRVAGKLAADAGQYSMSFAQLSDAIIVNMIPFALTMVIGAAVVLYHSLVLGLLVIAMTLTVVLITIYQTIKTNPKRQQRHAARKALIAHMADTVTNAQNVKIFAREDAEMRTQGKLSETLRVFRHRDFNRMATEGSQRIGALIVFEIGFVMLVLWLVKRDPSLLAIGIFTFSYAITLFNRLFEIGNLFRRVEDSLLDASDIIRLVYDKPEVNDVPGAQKLRVTNGEIEMKQVRFHYSDASSNDTVFDNLNLRILAGQKVGLVGPSGGGKSTLSRLLLRFEDIQDGQILIDGQAIDEITQQSLREAIAYVPQEPLLFHRTVAENITYGAPYKDRAAIEAAAKQAYAYDFIMALPQGFDTIVGERGVKLSGGQRQRVAIARAILKDAPIIVLDEATSALDSESEQVIQKSLANLMEGRTTIVIAHRLSTIQKLDRIIVLEGGAIKEDGSHAELLANKKLYARLWSHQSGGFIED